jgi:hypothetical protein
MKTETTMKQRDDEIQEMDEPALVTPLNRAIRRSQVRMRQREREVAARGGQECPRSGPRSIVNRKS